MADLYERKSDEKGDGVLQATPPWVVLVFGIFQSNFLVNIQVNHRSQPPKT